MVEVVHDPRVLILDEPTSGLDSNLATQVVGMVKGMAERHGRTVVMSVYQPRFRIVEMIDLVLVLADGLVAHFGRMDRLEMGFGIAQGWKKIIFKANRGRKNPSSVETRVDDIF